MENAKRNFSPILFIADKKIVRRGMSNVVLPFFEVNSKGKRKGMMVRKMKEIQRHSLFSSFLSHYFNRRHGIKSFHTFIYCFALIRD